MLQCIAVCCSVLQCDLLRSPLNNVPGFKSLQCVAVCCSVLQCVAVCCRVLQCDAVCCSVLQCVAVCCSVISWDPLRITFLVQNRCSMSQCVAVCRSVSQCVAVELPFEQRPWDLGLGICVQCPFEI